jgi:prevent-host-death family protein
MKDPPRPAAVTFALRPLAVGQALIQSSWACLGERDDLVSTGFELTDDSGIAAMLLAARDYRRLSSADETRPDSLRTSVRLETFAAQIPNLVRLLEDEGFFRIFVGSEQGRAIATLLSPEHFRMLAGDGRARFHLGERRIRADAVAGALFPAIEQFKRFDVDYRFGGEDGKDEGREAMLISAQRFLSLFERRLEEGVRCPDCAKLCQGWLETPKLIKAGQADAEVGDVGEEFPGLVEAAREEGSRYIISRRGVPAGVLLPRSDFLYLLAGVKPAVKQAAG